MPLRELGCQACNVIVEIYSPSLDPEAAAGRLCACGRTMSVLWSRCHVDTSDNFHPFDYQGQPTEADPQGKKWRINNLHELRKVEAHYAKTGHNVRFDAYSAEPSNPDPVDGYGLDYWDGKPTSTSGKVTMMPTMN